MARATLLRKPIGSRGTAPLTVKLQLTGALSASYVAGLVARGGDVKLEGRTIQRDLTLRVRPGQSVALKKCTFQGEVTVTGDRGSAEPIGKLSLASNMAKRARQTLMSIVNNPR